VRPGISARAFLRVDVPYSLLLGREQWVMRSDGADQIKVAPDKLDGGALRAPTWSPDGKRIAYIKSTWMNRPTITTSVRRKKRCREAGPELFPSRGRRYTPSVRTGNKRLTRCFLESTPDPEWIGSRDVTFQCLLPCSAVISLWARPSLVNQKGQVVYPVVFTYPARIDDMGQIVFGVRDNKIGMRD